MAGYSGTPLAKKLGLKAGFVIKTINPPNYYDTLFEELPEQLKTVHSIKVQKDFIHYFEVSAKKLEENIPKLKAELKPAGMIWVSWYKKVAKKPTDITEDTVRGIALANGLVDVKVCAIDEQWSGLKLVIPVKDR